MPINPQNPLVVQSDRSILLEVDNPQYGDARDVLARFAELEKSPEHIHTYRLSPLSLWNAAASGLTATDILDLLTRYSKYDVPGNIQADVRDYVSRFGRLKLVRGPAGELLLTTDDPILMLEVSRQRKVSQFIVEQIDARTARVNPALRGHVKKALVDVGFPAEDLAGYVDGAPLSIGLLPSMRRTGHAFGLRHYQQDAVEVFHAGGDARGGSGVIVLPCGAGKTMVGMGVMDRLQTNTLILTTNTVAVRQWIDELIDKTTLDTDMIGEYTGDSKEIRPVTIATYQILTYHRKGRKAEGELDEWSAKGSPDLEEWPHFKIFNERDWGLVIYDEVHLLPAPVFRMTAELQARTPPGPDRYAGTRRRPRGRGLRTDRTEALRRPLERPGATGLDRHGPLSRDQTGYGSGGAHRLRAGRKPRAVHDLGLRSGQARGCRRDPCQTPGRPGPRDRNLS